jgi:endonuclease/exonuclease/phosphatase family metal-dependent hydrolase
LVQKGKLDRQLKKAQEAQKLDPTIEIIVAMGDANWCYQRWLDFGGYSQPLEELFGFNFHEIGSTFTKGNSESAIDHVYSRKNSDSTISIKTSTQKSLSDHHQIVVTLTKNKVAVVTSDLAALNLN